MERTSPLHRRESEGQDSKGRLHGASAVQRLLNAVEVGPDWNHGAPVNEWDAAEEVVEAADQETKDAALRHLLALHMFDLLDEEPKVAMRNVQVGDVVELHGAARVVRATRGDGQGGSTVELLTALEHLRDADTDVFANGGDVRISLLHRVSVEVGARLFVEILNAAEAIGNIQPESRRAGQRQYMRGLERAFLLMTGVDPERLHEEVQEALQARHEERLDAEGY